MLKQICNPYLPFWETVPDGEPHIFDGRVYVYGSHDRLNGTLFCEEDYVGWSAPVDDLTDWRYEGVIFKKSQDPINGAPYNGEMPPYEKAHIFGDSLHCLYAPDVAQGPDGRYYLYYALDGVNVISVAVCDTPAGEYEFLDYVRYEDGRLPEYGRLFDPAILCEDSGNYLYYGFCPNGRFPGMEKQNMDGAFMVRLADDMHTVTSTPKLVANGVETATGTPYEAHPFFEASSIRHFGSWYYFVYSSLQGNELCYGMAKSPEGPFEYKGVIVSNGDMGYKGNTLPTNYMGNNHGGLEIINNQPYIFWHRQTHGHSYSRQGCADKVDILADGTIPQTEITSCGLNRGPLIARGRYDTYIACHLTGPDRSAVGNVAMAFPGTPLPKLPEDMPYITEEACPGGEKDMKPYIYNLCPGALAGFKYFGFDGTETVLLAELRGHGTLKILSDSPEGREIGRISCDSDGWTMTDTAIEKIEGTRALFFVSTDGRLDFSAFEIK